MSRPDRAGGFTLVELMVAITILAIIGGTLASAFIVTFRTADDANQRLALAHDKQISTAAFASDVQSADGVWTNDVTPLCGPTGSLLYLRWVDETTINHVTYAVATAGTETQLVRHRCTVGGPSSKQVLSHFVQSVQAPECFAATTPSPPTTACSGTSAVPDKPLEVVIRVNVGAAVVHELRGTRRPAP